MIIKTYSHFFKILVDNETEAKIIGKFASNYAPLERVFDKETKKISMKVLRVYASKCSGNEFRFHIGVLPEFETYIKSYSNNDIVITSTQTPMYIPDNDIVIKHKESWVLKDYQLKASEFIMNDELNSISRTRLLGLLTGKGKTVTAMLSLIKNNGRLFILVLPKYIDKWISDVKSILDIDDKEIMVLRESNTVIGLMSNSKDNKNSFKNVKIFICSLVSMRLVTEEYEKNGRTYWISQYDVHIEDMFENLGVSSVLIDEGHEHFHATFKIMLFCHVYKFLTLSGTMLSEDNFISDMQKLIYPPEVSMIDEEYTKHVTCVNLKYQFHQNHVPNIKTESFYIKDYNHPVFEKSIIRQKYCLENYITMLITCIERWYIKHRTDGDKCLLFVASVDLADIMLSRLKSEYPKLVIKKYFKSYGGKLEDILTSDITITSTGSAGAALDIKGLITVIMEDNKVSTKTNLQSLGRLRVIEDRDVYYIWLTSTNIKKHQTYNNERQNLLNGKVKLIENVTYEKLI